LLGEIARPPIEQQLTELKLTVERIAEMLEK
jgi:hypothetical protein